MRHSDSNTAPSSSNGTPFPFYQSRYLLTIEQGIKASRLSQGMACWRSRFLQQEISGVHFGRSCQLTRARTVGITS